MIKEKLTPKGTVKLAIHDSRTNELIKEITINNMIVNTGRGKIAHLLAGDVSSNSIAKISCGTSNTATALTDTGLTGVVDLAIGSASYPSGTSVKFNWLIGNADANGITIQELGLKTGGGILFSRVVIPAVVKTAAIYIIGTWEIDM